jgi:EmrB/QacA subfamily drug resistance transporter
VNSTQATNPLGLRSLPRRKVMFTFAGVMLAMFLGSLDQTIVGTAMPRIIADLDGFAQYTWVTTAYIITTAVAMPITGKLTDMYGRKYFYIAGLIIFCVASLMCGLSNTMTELIICRGIQGLGAGIMMANAFAVIGDLFSPAERGKYQGVISGVFGLSSIIGPTLGGFLTDSLSWHWIFFINIPLGVLIIILFIRYFPNFKPDNLKHKVDYLGMAALILTVVPLLLALSWGGSAYSWASATIIGLFIWSVISGILFILAERRAEEPLIPLSLFKNQIVTISVLASFFTAFGMFSAIIFVPLFFQGVLGLSATTSGSFLTPMMMGMVIGSFISGQLLSRAGGHYRLLGTVGMAILATGLGLLAIMNIETSYGIAVFNIVLVGLGLGATFPVLTITVQNAVPYSMLGVATSSIAFFRSIGGSVGLAIFGSVMNNRFQSSLLDELSPEVMAALPPGQLEALAGNPQALVSPEAQAQISSMLEQSVPGGIVIWEQLLHGLRAALDNAISQVFLIALIMTVISLLIYLFIKEVPLRKDHRDAAPPDK